MENSGFKIFYSARKTIVSYVKGGNPLIVATVLALVVANVPFLSDYYFQLWNQDIKLQIGDFNLFSHDGHPMSLMAFINDALMAVFFFTIGLEIKREILVGELSSIKQAMLPIVGALGGMIVPVGIFYLMSAGSDFSRGAAIPMATDIAFSLGVLAMLGSRVPISLKIFLTTLAVVDDIGGILVIAIFYSGGIEYTYLLYSLVAIVLLLLGSVFKVQSKMYYLIIGGAVWYLFLNSGIHPTIAGVIVAFCIPARPVFNPKKYISEIRSSIAHFPVDAEPHRAEGEKEVMLSKEQMDWLKQIESASDKVISPLQELEDSLHPVVNYLIIPIFAFANAGIFLGDMSVSDLYSGVGLAVICGLFIGKFAGIFSFSWLAVKAGLAPMPYGANWKMLSAVSVLGGIGFTVSLFIANLSFPDMLHHDTLNSAKLAILAGSLLSGLAGYTFLKFSLPKVSADDKNPVK